MNQKAQASLEYLMTYGWALVIIASVVGVLVFVINPTSATASFSSSDPSKIMLKGSSITENTAGLVLQNITGGAIKVNSVHFFGDLGAGSNWALNGVSPKDFPIEVSAGSEMHFKNLVSQNNCTNGGSIVLFYSDFAGFEKRADISCNSGAKMPIVWYRFDEGNGEIASDSSWNENAATLNGNPLPTWAKECPSNDCISFVGTASNYAISLNTVEIPTKYTVIEWVKGELANQNGAQNIYGTGWDSKIAFRHASVGTNPVTGFLIRDASDTTYYNVSAYSSTHLDGLWHILVATVDREILEVNVYLDGALLKSQTIPSHYSGSRRLIVGSFSTGYGLLYGLNDEAKIYDRILTNFEICSLCLEHNPTETTCNCTP